MTRTRTRLLALAAIAAMAGFAWRGARARSADGRREWLRSPQAAFLAYRRERLVAAELGDCGCAP